MELTSVVWLLKQDLHNEMSILVKHASVDGQTSQAPNYTWRTGGSLRLPGQREYPVSSGQPLTHVHEQYRSTAIVVTEEEAIWEGEGKALEELEKEQGKTEFMQTEF